MKVTLHITLTIPDECQVGDDAHLAQNLFDDYVNYVTIKHMRDATHWLSRQKEMPSAERIAQHHSLWGDITNLPEWTFERVPS